MTNDFLKKSKIKGTRRVREAGAIERLQTHDSGQSEGRARWGRYATPGGQGATERHRR